MRGARLKGINTTKKRLADGTVAVYRYHRATGAPLPGDPGSAEFVQAWLEAEKITPRDGSTVAGLIRLYLGSLRFEKKAESTRREYRRMLTALEAKFGTMPIKALASRRVRGVFLAYHEEIGRQHPREADNRMTVLSAVFTHAADRGVIGENPITRFGRLHDADRREFVWTEGDIAKFMQDAPVELQRALILAIHTGQRYGDLVRLRWSDIVAPSTDAPHGCIALRQRKTKMPVLVPIMSGLHRELAHWPKAGPYILTREDGRPWPTKGDDKKLSKDFHAHARAVGIDKLEFRDLRGTAVVMLAAAGLEVPQIGSLTGHTMKSAYDILERYGARNQAVAKAAVIRLENAPETVLANRLQTKPQARPAPIRKVE